MTRHFIKAVVATIASASDLNSAIEESAIPDTCCQFYNFENFNSQPFRFCLEEDEAKTFPFLNFNLDENQIRSARCGLHVAAKLCPGKAKFGQVDGQRADKFDCVGSPGAETGFVFDANSEYKSLSD